MSAVIRDSKVELAIESTSKLVFKVHSVKTIINKDDVDFGTPYISYEKGDKISNVSVKYLRRIW